MNGKQRILVVDDEPQITRVLRRMLTTHGYDVHVAATRRVRVDRLPVTGRHNHEQCRDADGNGHDV